MTIIQFEYFLAVVNNGSFSAASEQCFVSQPALSRQISMLEEELGVLLINRNSRPLVPTAAGEAMLPLVRETVGMFYGTRERINDMRGDLSGKIKIGVIPTISPYLMPKFIARFAQRCPNVKFDVVDMHTADIIDALSRDMIDIAILSGGQSEVKIKEEQLFEDRLLMYVSRENELYGRSAIEVDDIDVRKLLILSQGNCLRNQVLKLCRRRREVELQYDFMNCSLETLMHTADEIGGTTIVPGMAVGYISAERRDQIIPFASKRANRSITMAVGHTCVREALVVALRTSILEAYAQLMPAEFLI